MPSVDDLKPQRRPFQFSLRKLLLWTAVWSIYLGIVKWVGIWLALSVETWLVFSLGLTIYLVALLAVRMKWGCERGLRIAVTFMVGLPLLLVGALLFWLMVISPVDFVQNMVFLPLLCFSGFFLGWYGFLFVHCVVRAVNWLDNLMETKPPKEP